MSWTVAVLKNSVEISDDVAQALIDKVGKHIPTIDIDDNPTPEDLLDGDTLFFNYDHMEWIDWLGRHDDILPTLANLNVEGDICFGSVEGDNAGSFWGYRFDGKGGFKRLKGTISWNERK